MDREFPFLGVKAPLTNAAEGFNNTMESSSEPDSAFGLDPQARDHRFVFMNKPVKSV